MAMIKCPECGKEVSDLAGSCPNCGFPLGFESPNNRTNNQNIPTNNAVHIPHKDVKKKESVCGIIGLVIAVIALFSANIIFAIIAIILCSVAVTKKDCKVICGKIGLGIGIFAFIVSMLAPTYLKYVNKAREAQNTQSETNSENLEAETKTETQKKDVKKADTDTKKDIANNSDEYISITSTELIDAYNENQVKCKQNYDGKLLMVTGKVESIGTDIMGSTYVCLGHDTEFTFVGIQCFAKDNDTINEIAELKEGDLITVSGKGECGSLSFSMKNIKIEEVTKEIYTDENGEEIENLTSGQSNALKSAKSYLEFSAFSYDGLIRQLEYEQYSHEDSVFAVDNCGADWNEQAVKSAKSYLEFSSFSRDGLIEQLEYEGFTHEQAVYGVEKNGY